ncbi:VOC family protein [Klenkia sp. PcliD-1-E]|uniref:VOC family protein n=1 Tax=Klenkia sp. PcliD-1-E TaxID=2954492 RepID=UPI0020985EE5|nr:VOC family protein [Klenkia sp. PcliD-1-E]MCO7218858.1 hypothetical protein [Klenkia sp. PcliD-1-E]
MAAAMSVFLCARDPRALVDQLVAGLGFEELVVWPDADGGIAHAELRLGDAVVLVQTDHVGYRKPEVTDRCVGAGTVLTLDGPDEVDAVHARAVAAGMTSLIAPQDTPWGNHRAELLDREGYQWSICTYRPGGQG